MKKIVFVDDDVNSLNSMRRMLTRMRREWSFEFAESGDQALEILAKEKYDVVVADMRMPKMDGAQLLTVIKNKYPWMVRIILSGHSDPDVIMNSIGPCHQFLAKPCSSQILKDTINRACALRNLLSDEKIQTTISSLEALPSVPALYVELQKEIRSEDASIRNASRIIAKDPGMSAKILQLVNSAFFGLPRHVSDVEQAVSLLGLEVINALVLSTQIFHLFEADKVNGFSLEKLAQHNLTVGAFAKEIAKSEKVEKRISEQSFMAGLMHDIGKLVLVSDNRQDYGRAIDMARSGEIELWQAEETIFNNSHAAVGGYLLGLWGIPDVIIEAIVYHQRPSASFLAEFGPLAAIHVANVISYKLAPNTAIGAAPEFDLPFLDRVGCTEKLDQWIKLCSGLNGAKDE